MSLGPTQKGIIEIAKVILRKDLDDRKKISAIKYIIIQASGKIPGSREEYQPGHWQRHLFDSEGNPI